MAIQKNDVHSTAESEGYVYCKLVKVRTLCILCNNWCLFGLWSLTPVWFGFALYTVWVEFPRPDRQTVYIQNRDRSSLVIESIIYDSWSQKHLTNKIHFTFQTFKNKLVWYLLFFKLVILNIFLEQKNWLDLDLGWIKRGYIFRLYSN